MFRDNFLGVEKGSDVVLSTRMYLFVACPLFGFVSFHRNPRKGFTGLHAS